MEIHSTMLINGSLVTSQAQQGMKAVIELRTPIITSFSVVPIA